MLALQEFVPARTMLSLGPFSRTHKNGRVTSNLAAVRLHRMRVNVYAGNVSLVLGIYGSNDDALQRALISCPRCNRMRRLTHPCLGRARNE